MAVVEYKVIKNFFTKEELPILDKYCHNKMDQNNDYYYLDHQTSSPSWYNDPLVTAMLDLKLPIVEQHSNLKLFPTFGYWRYYVFGAMLKTHTDRFACEIAISACIKKYDNWPLIIEGEKIELEEGDALLYAGCEQIHKRPGIYKGDGIAQMFLFYVNKNGPYKDHAYDQIQRKTF